MKVSYNANFEHLVTFITDHPETVRLEELISFALENQAYKDLYVNWHILRDLIQEHNSNVKAITKAF